MSNTAQMPQYQCHKKVWALKILDVDVGRLLLIVEAPFDAIPITAEWHAKHNPQPGGYYVQYEDGYTSYSPAKAFEEGYRLIKPTRMSHLTNEQLVSKLLEEGVDGFILDEACDRLDPDWRDR